MVCKTIPEHYKVRSNVFSSSIRPNATVIRHNSFKILSTARKGFKFDNIYLLNGHELLIVAPVPSHTAEIV